jgi:hypothetical protein
MDPSVAREQERLNKRTSVTPTRSVVNAPSPVEKPQTLEDKETSRLERLSGAFSRTSGTAQPSAEQVPVTREASSSPAAQKLSDLKLKQMSEEQKEEDRLMKRMSRGLIARKLETGADGTIESPALEEVHTDADKEEKRLNRRLSGAFVRK